MSKIQNFSLHTHTTFSDGNNTIDEMLAQAVNKGFKKYGVSDHLTVYDTQNPQAAFAAVLSKCKQYLSDIRLAAANYPLKVLTGFEVDFYNTPGWLKAFDEFIAELDVDYIFTGNHYAFDNEIKNRVDIVEMKNFLVNPQQQIQYLHNHFRMMREAVYSRRFLWLAHLDFARWGGVMQDGDFRDEIMDIIHALSETSTATEINTKGYVNVGGFYPSTWILQELKAHKIPVLISDDAHHSSQIGRYFTEAEQLLEDINYPYRYEPEI